MEEELMSSEQRMTVNTTEEWRGGAVACASGWVSEHEDGMGGVHDSKRLKDSMHQMRR